MAKTLIHPHALAKALKDHGLVPDKCRNIELHFGVDAVAFIRYEVLVGTEDLMKLSAAFTAVDAEINKS